MTLPPMTPPPMTPPPMKTPKASRAALALTLFLLPLAACHRSPPEDPNLIHVSLQTDWYPQPEQGGFYDAVVKGYYRDAGLDVKILPGGPYANAEAQVASGSIQFAMQSSDHVLEAIANANEPLVAIGATMQQDPQGVMVRADSPVHSFADLDGHTVAVRTGSTWWEFIVQRFHLKHVHEVPVTFSVANFVRDPNYIQQCFLTSEPYFADRAGAPARVLLNSTAGYNPYRVFMTSRGYLAAHPDVVAKFTRASLRGWRDYMQDPIAANQLIEKLNPAMSRDWAAYSYAALKRGNFVTGDDPADLGKFDPDRWAVMYEQLRGLGVLNRPIDPGTAFTNQFNQ